MRARECDDIDRAAELLAKDRLRVDAFEHRQPRGRRGDGWARLLLEVVDRTDTEAAGLDDAGEPRDPLAVRGRDVRAAGLLPRVVAHGEDRRDSR